MKLNINTSLMARANYLSWNETFMSIAEVIAKRSKDPSTQVGCCIVNTNRIVIGLGYNGFPRGCDDGDFPWSKSGDIFHETKYAYVVHAEQNAILNSSQSTANATMYVTRYPCNECAKFIIQAGIKKIYYQSNPLPDHSSTIAANRMFKSAGIELICHSLDEVIVEAAGMHSHGHYTNA